MFAFALLRVTFAHCMGGSGEMALIDASGISIEVLQPKRLEQLPQFDNHSICATTKRIRQHHPCQMVNRMPQPALLEALGGQ
jgi:hypothetical protein